MNALRRLAIATASTALLGGLATPTLATDTVTVQAQVSIDAPCLTVSATSVDFGHQRLSVGSDITRVRRPFGYESCSSTQESVFVRATDAHGDASTWSLGASNEGCGLLEPNFFRLYGQFLDPTGRDRLIPFVTTDAQIDQLGPGATGIFANLEMWMPCSGSDGTGETMSFDIVLTATF